MHDENHENAHTGVRPAPSPDNLSPSQEASATIIQNLVERYKLEWRALGRNSRTG
jgi:hypothetical protein